MKQKDQNINSNAQKCGPNAGLLNNACYCFANSFEKNRGDANKREKGCKSKEKSLLFLNFSGHTFDLFFLDPCESGPCQGDNTVCIQKSSSKFKCLCEENYFGIDGNARLNGCQKEGIVPQKKCGPNSDLSGTGKCRCNQDYFEEAKGDANTQKGCQSKRFYQKYIDF